MQPGAGTGRRAVGRVRTTDSAAPRPAASSCRKACTRSLSMRSSRGAEAESRQRLDESVDMAGGEFVADGDRLKYIKIGKDEGAKMLCGGHRLEVTPTRTAGSLRPRYLPMSIPRCGSRRKKFSASGVDHSVRWAGERHRDRQRHRLRIVVVDLHQGREQGVHRDARSVCGHHVHQCTDDWR